MAVFFLLMGMGPLVRGVAGLDEASRHRAAGQARANARIASLREERARLSHETAQLRNRVMFPQTGMGRPIEPDEAASRRYWVLQGDIAFIDAQIRHEEQRMKQAEKAADAVPFLVGMVVLGLAIWALGYFLVFRIIPRAKLTLAFVPTEDLAARR